MEQSAIICHNQSAIIIFARFPTPGFVKTRLAASVGNETATEFYSHCALHVINECCNVPDTVCYVFYSVMDEAHLVESWLLPTYPRLLLLSQMQDPNLGARLHHAMAHVLSLGHTKALVVGTDVPDLTTAVLVKALAAIEPEASGGPTHQESDKNNSTATHQVVLGPAADGGYYLMGVAAEAMRPDLFSGITWSTDQVLKQQAAAVQACGLTLAPLDLLPTLVDIDTIQDLVHWVKQRTSGSKVGQIGCDFECGSRYAAVVHAAETVLLMHHTTANKSLIDTE